MKSRRTFLKKSVLTGLVAELFFNSAEAHLKNTDETFTVLITADIHAQLFTHDEFFWENEQPVFRKRGGLAGLYYGKPGIPEKWIQEVARAEEIEELAKTLDKRYIKFSS